MNKSQKLIELLRYVNIKKVFTAQDVAEEFHISIRSAHRYLLELSDLGVYFFTEQGRNGGYRLISSRILPPVNFTEDEALSIFFAFQSLCDYTDVPFDVDMHSVSHKLYTNLPKELQDVVDRMNAILMFRNTHSDIQNIFLKQLLLITGSKKIIDIDYQKQTERKTYTIVPIGMYANHGYWYAPSYDIAAKRIKHFRVDRILSLQDTGNQLDDCTYTLQDCFHYHIAEPLHLCVKLNKQGVQACLHHAFLSQDVKLNKDDDGGYIDEIIDKRDISYLGDFFLHLGKHAEVVEPEEMRIYILNKINELLMIYG